MAQVVRDAPGLQAKRDLRVLPGALGLGGRSDDAPGTCGLGDDAAAVATGAGEHLLFAAEAIWPPFAAASPHAAGVAAVNANVADVRAMGGRPAGLLSTVVAHDEAQAELMLRGIAEGADLLGVPVLGGHLSLGHDPALSAFVWGSARALLSSAAAHPGDRVLLAACLDGSYLGELAFFSSLRVRTREQLRGDGEPLVEIAEAGICRSARDVSMPGVIGSLLQLLEPSGSGALIDIDRIPRPAGVALERWLLTFPSYGFLLCVQPGRVDEARAAFHHRGLACEAIGTVDASARLRLGSDGEEALVWDLEAEALTGLR